MKARQDLVVIGPALFPVVGMVVVLTAFTALFLINKGTKLVEAYSG